MIEGANVLAPLTGADPGTMAGATGETGTSGACGTTSGLLGLKVGVGGGGSRGGNWAAALAANSSRRVFAGSEANSPPDRGLTAEIAVRCGSAPVSAAVRLQAAMASSLSLAPGISGSARRWQAAAAMTLPRHRQKRSDRLDADQRRSADLRAADRFSGRPSEVAGWLRCRPDGAVLVMPQSYHADAFIET